MDENDFMVSVIENMTDTEFEAYCKTLEELIDIDSGKENNHE